MARSLKHRLLLTGAILFFLVVVASSALSYTASQYNFYVERSIRAQMVYANYRAVSDHTYRKLSALGRIVEEGSLINLEERYRNKEALRTALRNVRESISADLAHVGDIHEAAELEHFNKIEELAEEIIHGSELVREAIEKDQEGIASEALGNLRSLEVEGSFIRLIDDALLEELTEIGRNQLVAQDLNTLLNRLLYAIFLLVIIIAGLLLMGTWKALNRSLFAFEKATSAYQRGQFSHRVNDDVEVEFKDLAIALNNMAIEVGSQRERERNAQENLESIIASRTHELRSTNEKLETISETRKQFLADISHELRTPLTIMMGEADLALGGEAKTTEQFRTALSRIKEQTVHTTRLVQDLLFVARAEDGKAPIHKASIDIVPLIRDVCDDFSVITEESRIAIEINFYNGELFANVDAAKIKQVVVILLDNAVRYSYENSTIQVSVQPEQSSAVLKIEDSGIGLNMKESSQIFSRFYRGSAGSGKASGTGLGLPVAKAIIDAHGGSISLSSDSGTGTVATVILPQEES